MLIVSLWVSIGIFDRVSYLYIQVVNLNMKEEKKKRDRERKTRPLFSDVLVPHCDNLFFHKEGESNSNRMQIEDSKLDEGYEFGKPITMSFMVKPSINKFINISKVLENAT